MTKTEQKSFRFSPDMARLLVKLARSTRRSQTNVMEVALLDLAQRLNVPVSQTIRRKMS